MRILFLGDFLGRSGRDAAIDAVPRLRERLSLDLVVANGENAAAGFGITSTIAGEAFDAGIDVITLGNHAFDNREILSQLDHEPRIVRPLNIGKGAPGRGATLVETTDGRRVLVMNVLGKVFMNAMGDPFSMVEEELNACPMGEACDAAIIDVHAEATSEKMAMGHWCDGRASLVVGTHTHVPTGDAQILPGGTAYQTDAGMCGDYDSVIGMDKEEPMRRFVTGLSSGRFEPKIGDATICGVYVETDDATGLALYVAPLRMGGRLRRAWPLDGRQDA